MATSDLSSAPRNARSQPCERALLVHLFLTAASDEDDLTELRLLAESAGACVCGTVVGRRPRPDAATFVGKGKADEIRAAVEHEQIDLVLVNHELTPGQERNLEKIVGCRVLDRTGLILDIFAQRARSHEGNLQVELAQLERLSTRLVRGWTHLERQKGGIGLRGPGETQLETDRRLLRERIKHLTRRLEKVRNQRDIRRKSRNKVPIPTVSLVGYTNAGKSSLFNRLSGADIYAADQLFATLDPTMRRIQLPGNTPVILADTVGFIRQLPHNLVEAFKSTLEEVEKAEVLLHVIDAASPEYREHIERVNEVLGEIHAESIPQIQVFNKIDLLGQSPRIERDVNGCFARVWMSAATGVGADLLLQVLADYYRQRRRDLYLRLPATAGRLRARLYERTEVLEEIISESGGWQMHVALDGDKLAWLQKQADFEPEYVVEEPAVLAPTGS